MATIPPGHLAVADLVQFKKTKVLPPGYPADRITFWSGVDDIHGAILAVLNDASRELRISMYGYDDDFFDAAIRSKLDYGLFVQLSLDKSQAGGIHEREILKAWQNDKEGHSIAIGQSPHGAINHTKVVAVDGKWLITGSTNWSTSGETLQNNECTITLNPYVTSEAVTELSIIHDSMLSQMSKAKPAA